MPRLSDAELLTLAVLQALLGFTSEARFIRHDTFDKVFRTKGLKILKTPVRSPVATAFA